MLTSGIDELDAHMLGLLAAEPRVGTLVFVQITQGRLAEAVAVLEEVPEATATHQIRYRTAPLVEAALSG